MARDLLFSTVSFSTMHFLDSLLRKFAGVWTLTFLVLLGFCPSAWALDEKQARENLAKAILTEGEEQQNLITSLSGVNSEYIKEILVAWPRDEVFVYTDPAGVEVAVTYSAESDTADTRVATRIDNGEEVRGLDGATLRFATKSLPAAETDSKLRKYVRTVIDLMALADADPQARRSAATKLGMSQRPEYIPVLEARMKLETSSSVKKAFEEAIAIAKLNDPNLEVRKMAVQTLSKLNSITSLDTLKRMEAAESTSAELKPALNDAVRSIEGYISGVNFFGTIFRGLSAGSILLVVALGLAITFGLMGVINMAHGELIVVGAYVVFLVENIFGKGLSLSPFGHRVVIPGLQLEGWLYESYFIVSLPLAFLGAAAVGLLLERGIIRFLYRRPLESLLATWGVSLVLQQLFRSCFGAANVQVNSPRWLLGNFTISDVVLGYNRLFVIAFAVIVVAGTWLLLNKTPLGLLIRAVMQKRDMAACMGVRTQRVNMMTFAFGSGLAGLAGAFLSQIGNVGPNLGQTYIVDCFMTVVLGGVGNLFGTVYSALGVGVVDQTLQQVLLNPVLGKIIVLGAIILFLQWKPEGIFAQRSRTLD